MPSERKYRFADEKECKALSTAVVRAYPEPNASVNISLDVVAGSTPMLISITSLGKLNAKLDLAENGSQMLI